MEKFPNQDRESTDQENTEQDPVLELKQHMREKIAAGATGHFSVEDIEHVDSLSDEYLSMAQLVHADEIPLETFIRWKEEEIGRKDLSSIERKIVGYLANVVFVNEMQRSLEEDED